MTDAIPPLPPMRTPPPRADTNAKLHQLAQDLEASFLSEMLGHAGLGAARDSFGGGIGEQQFESFLRQEQAAAMVKSGGIGLAESLFKSMLGGRDAGVNG